MEWSFHYAGPRAADVDYKCVTCIAGKTKECPTHGKSFASACAHCIAAQGGPCRAHWGIDAALAAHPVPADPLGAEDWADAIAYVQKHMANLPPERTHVIVRLRGDFLVDPSGKTHRESHHEIIA